MESASLAAAIQVMRCDYSSYSNKIRCAVMFLCYASLPNISWLNSLPISILLISCVPAPTAYSLASRK